MGEWTYVFFADVGKAFGHDDQLVAWDAVLFDRLAEDLLRSTVAVDICGVPCIQATVVGSLQKRERFLLIQDPWLPIRAAIMHTTHNGHCDS